MDASTFPRISSAPRPVRSGRAPKEHRRKGGGGIGEPEGGRRLGGAFSANCVPNGDGVMLKILEKIRKIFFVGGAFSANCVPNGDGVMLKILEKIRKIFFDCWRIMLYFCCRISIQPLPGGKRDL